VRKSTYQDKVSNTCLYEDSANGVKQDCCKVCVALQDRQQSTLKMGERRAGTRS
jgi:hypothetical protein